MTGSDTATDGDTTTDGARGARRRHFPVRVLGTGAYRPSRRVASAQLDTDHGRPPGATERRSGVRERWWASEAETSSVMAAAALRRACVAAATPPERLDAVIVASVVPEQPMPTTAVLVLRALGLADTAVEAFDVNASCLGFLTGFELATLGIAAGQWDRVAVVATEITSKGLNHADTESSALFGDGAAAAVLAPSAAGEQSAVLAMRSATWSRGALLCEIPAGGTRLNAVTPPPRHSDYLFRMDGRGLLRLAAQKLPDFLAGTLAAAGLALGEVDVVVPHQVSAVGLRYLRERIGVPANRYVDVLAGTGNQVSASLPTALHHAVETGRLERGQHALLLGTAAGLSIGAVVLRY